MASTSQVMLIRLRSGGVLLITPAFVLPWPRVLGRKQRRLQEVGIQRALADPQAMSRLRRELPRLLDIAHPRGAQPDSDADLAKAVMTNFRNGVLTVIFGVSEPSLRQSQVGELMERFDGHPVIDATAKQVRAPALDPMKSLPDHLQPLPNLYVDKMRWVCGRTLLHMSSEDRAPMQEFFSDRSLAVTSVLFKMWSETQEAGAGFVVDAGMFATALWELGHEASVALDFLSDGFTATRSATHWSDMDVAARSMAAAVLKMGAPLLRQFLRQIGDRTGGTGQSVGEFESHDPFSASQIGSPQIA